MKSKIGYQIIKWALIFVLSFTTFNFFLSGEVSSTIEIEAPIDSVYDQVINLHNWPNWAVWWKQDTSMITTFSEDPAFGKGSYMKWDGEKYQGSLKILDYVHAQSISYALYVDGDSSMVLGIWTFKENDEGVTVNWKFKENLPFFVRFMSFFITPDLDEGLQSLKEVCEKDTE